MLFKGHKALPWNREPLLHTNAALTDERRTHSLDFATKEPPPAGLFALLESVNATEFLGAKPGHLLFDLVIVGRQADADAPLDPMTPVPPEHFYYTLACSLVEARKVPWNSFYTMPPEGRPYLVETNNRAAADLAAFFRRMGFV